MLQTICSACEFGEHYHHTEIIQAPPPGMIGGSSCRCEGECVDGRYCPPQFKNTLKAIQDKMKEEPDEAEAIPPQPA